MRTVVIHNVTLQIGSNRAENDRLFHQALDHDIWFHIDQHPSAHMWMPGVDKSHMDRTIDLSELKENTK